ncbi:hypothetical protein KRX52_17195 [Pseudomonas sp. MAP12]|uniref:Lipoprotein n=1 Tax=Geopseudomonas aromaticivorans TaxID=2849492 RepID=A0ABS6N0D5_9GAMM|nr:hypothetical protein [Pseudomonas aromaticivorans]MBV2134517.1 hypothetical protein [Pseudomonas aromaticivorans]
MKALVPLMLLTTLAGCMTYEEGRVGDLGHTVYLTTYQQIADKEGAANPGTEVSPTGTDGPLVERVMDDFRGVTGDASQIAQPIQINVGN